MHKYSWTAAADATAGSATASDMPLPPLRRHQDEACSRHFTPPPHTAAPRISSTPPLPPSHRHIPSRLTVTTAWRGRQVATWRAAGSRVEIIYSSTKGSFFFFLFQPNTELMSTELWTAQRGRRTDKKKKPTDYLHIFLSPFNVFSVWRKAEKRPYWARLHP